MSRYRRYDGGDPLAPPVDIAEALDAIGEDVMAGYSPERAMREFLRRGGRGERRIGGGRGRAAADAASAACHEGIQRKCARAQWSHRGGRMSFMFILQSVQSRRTSPPTRRSSTVALVLMPNRQDDDESRGRDLVLHDVPGCAKRNDQLAAKRAALRDILATIARERRVLTYRQAMEEGLAA